MTTETQNKTGLGTGSTSTSSPDFLRINTPAKQVSQTTGNRYLDVNGRDEFDHQMLSHRAELEALDNQIANLDKTIELEQQKLRESKAALEVSYHARVRLLHLRSAMLHFVLELESRQVE